MQALARFGLRGRRRPGAPPAVGSGFTLIELLTAITVLAILAALLLPVLARARSKGYTITCLSNERQLMLACLTYAGDYDDRLPYNLGAAEIKQHAAQNRFPFGFAVPHWGQSTVAAAGATAGRGG